MEKKPEEPRAYRTGTGDQAQVDQPTAEERAEYVQNSKGWTRDNEAALGAMTIKMRDDFATHWEETAAETWAHLEKTFGKETQAQIYQWWKELSCWRIPGHEAPGKEFARWNLLIDKLTKAEQTIPTTILDFILMENIPCTYSNIEPMFLAGMHNQKLSTESIKALCRTEWERKQPPAPKLQTKVAAKVSAIKHKGHTTSFQEQQKPKASGSTQRDQQQQGEWRQRGKHGGTKTKKGKKPNSKGKGKAHAHFVGGESDDSSGSGEDDRLFAHLTIADFKLHKTTGQTLLSDSLHNDSPFTSKPLPDRQYILL
jgi:hypothetical protein